MSTEVRTTYQDYRALPGDGPRYQLIEGELIEMSPSPTTRHQRIAGRLFVALSEFVEKRKLGEVFCAPLDVVLSEVNVLQPDVLFVSHARKAIVKDDEGIMGAPDLCVEVLSPSNVDKEMNRKRGIYAQFGVTELWQVDLEAHKVEVYLLQKDALTPAQVFKVNETLRTPMLPGFALELAGLFG